MAKDQKRDTDVDKFDVVRRRGQHSRASDDVPRGCVVVEVTYGFDRSFPQDELREELLAVGAHLVKVERLTKRDGYRAKLHVLVEPSPVQAAYDVIDSFFECLNDENEIDRRPERARVIISKMSHRATGLRRLELRRTHYVCLVKSIDHVLQGGEFIEREERKQLEQACDIALNNIKAIDNATDGRFA